jgi:hypothetical protein
MDPIKEEMIITLLVTSMPAGSPAAVNYLARNRCGTRHDYSRDSHTTSVLAPTHFEQPRARHNTHFHKYYIQ